MDDLSLQERFFPGMTCFGCGPANPKGLQLRSYPTETGTVADFVPWPEHDNGLGFLNGGIICTVLDCHSATPMLLEAERLGLIPNNVALPFVTAGLTVRYLRPTPLSGPTRLLATVAEVSDSTMEVDVELWAQEKLRVQGRATWKRWTPR